MRTGIRKLPIPLGSAACTAGARRVAGAIGTDSFGSAEIGPIAERVFSLQMGGHGSGLSGIPAATLIEYLPCPFRLVAGVRVPLPITRVRGFFWTPMGSSGGAALNSPTGTQRCNLPSRDLTRHEPSLSPITWPIGSPRLSRTRNPRLHCVSGSALVSDGSRAKPRKAKNPMSRPMVGECCASFIAFSELLRFNRN